MRYRAVCVVVLLLALSCPAPGAGRKFRATGNSDLNHRAAPYKQGEVVVTFDTMPTRVSFDLPGHIKLITENGIPYTNGATETYIPSEGFHEGASYESWNDKDNKYSRMWIESQNDARIVVRHRCALIKGDKICHQDKRKVAPYGPGNWTDEWYVFHPDGTHIRRIKIWNAVAGESGRHGAKYPYELEGMYLWWGRPCKGKIASDHLEDGMITLIKMDGSHKTINLNPYPLKKNEYRKMSGVYGEFRNANIHVINTKSKYRPWRMGRWSRTLSVTPYVPVHKLAQLVPCFPPATTRASGYSVAGLGQMNWGEFWKRTDTSMSEIWLNGFTTSREPAEELAALARSWLSAPEMKVAGSGGVAARGYSVGDRAYLLDATDAEQPQEIRFEIAASEERPVRNPAFLIKNWTGGRAVLELDDGVALRGKDCRMGRYKTLKLEDGREWKNVLVVWAKISSVKPIRLSIRPAPLTVRPLPSSTSACRSFATICSGLYSSSSENPFRPSAVRILPQDLDQFTGRGSADGGGCVPMGSLSSGTRRWIRVRAPEPWWRFSAASTRASRPGFPALKPGYRGQAYLNIVKARC